MAGIGPAAVASMGTDRPAHVAFDADAPAVLETRGLTLRFGGATIVDDVSFAVPEGLFVSVIGPNGAGKTSLFNLLSGLYRPTAGRVLLRGADLTPLSPSARARRGLGRSFQLTAIFPGLTTLENARLAAQAARPGNFAFWRGAGGDRRATERAAWALETVGLRGKDAVLAAALAHGDKRKLDLALLLCGEPEVLLLDEPTAGVSAEEVPVMLDVIRRIRRVEGKTVLMVEHKMEAVHDLSDRVAVLANGALVAYGAPDAVMADPFVRSAYLGVA
ncbi:MAG: Branched-chain amino acid transport ATP-binding protein LivG [uncultured Thermomicrobiales bacterium]|uniref:Branched-chain amino acid transport ATP-binding protein LivG n=1 Tax=uncultured Thermomicrobiales bacterium TaxID=1645740 RepID=A0A6J4VR78_9BACT|nr:MAG: Branched-chain amino acid transport ATP-binding protein LivG [uncultured Thermomicrobiales bacterium]